MNHDITERVMAIMGSFTSNDFSDLVHLFIAKKFLTFAILILDLV